MCRPTFFFSQSSVGERKRKGKVEGNERWNKNAKDVVEQKAELNIEVLGLLSLVTKSKGLSLFWQENNYFPLRNGLLSTKSSNIRTPRITFEFILCVCSTLAAYPALPTVYIVHIYIRLRIRIYPQYRYICISLYVYIYIRGCPKQTPSVFPPIFPPFLFRVAFDPADA